MVLDMNINLIGVDEYFLEELEELIEDYRVEYFILNPINEEELIQTQKICNEYERFKYTLPITLKSLQDSACVAYQVFNEEQLDLVGSMPLVIESKHLDEVMIDMLNCMSNHGVILNAKQSDIPLSNFVLSISHESVKDWSNKAMMDFDYNKLALQSDYPNYSYDDLFDGLLKQMSDMTFRAEQSIASGGTGTLLKTFSML